MLEDLYDNVSLLFSQWWPTADGEITAIDIDTLPNRNSDLRLAVAYKFSVRGDGPFTGESFWRPSLLGNQRVAEASHQLRVGQAVAVRYRSDDPSVNKLDRMTWQDL